MNLQQTKSQHYQFDTATIQHTGLSSSVLKFLVDKSTIADVLYSISGSIVDRETEIPITDGLVQVQVRGKIIGASKLSSTGEFVLDLPSCFLNDIHVDLKILSLGYQSHHLMAISVLEKEIKTYSSKQLSARISVNRSSL